MTIKSVDIDLVCRDTQIVQNAVISTGPLQLNTILALYKENYIIHE